MSEKTPVINAFPRSPEGLFNFVQSQSYVVQPVDPAIAEAQIEASQPELPATDVQDSPEAAATEPQVQPAAAAVPPVVPESVTALNALIARQAADIASRDRADAERRKSEATAAEQAERNRFIGWANQINQESDPDVKAQETIKYQQAKAMAEIRRRDEQIASLQRENATYSDQQSAKNIADMKKTVVSMTLAEHNLSPAYGKLLMRAESPDQFEAMLEDLLAAIPKQEEEQKVEKINSIIDSGIYTPGGGTGSSVPKDGPAKRSGDLMGLLAATRYTRSMVQEN